MQTSDKGDPGGSLSIGTVAKLTGISVHTLRAWEKRHGVVSVQRSGTGRRLYGAEDVHRLRLLKKLTRAGHSIGNVARLDDTQLERMLALDDEDTNLHPAARRPVDTLVFSEMSQAPLELPPPFVRRIDIKLSTRDLGELREALGGRQRCAVVLRFSGMHKHQLRMLRQLVENEPGHHYFVVFHSAPRELIDELHQLGLTLLRAPIPAHSLFDQVLKLFRGEGAVSSVAEGRFLQGGEIPPHRYSRRQLERLARIPSAIACECPRHLAALLRELTLFESYCQSCSSKHPQDAMLHNEIYKISAQARAHLERAIALVIEAENINIDSNVAQT